MSDWDRDNAEHITRVSERIGRLVHGFVKERLASGEQFTMDELNVCVSAAVGEVAPDSPGRILRDLRRAGEVNYEVVSRRDSLYRALPVGQQPGLPEGVDARLVIVGDVHARGKNPRSRKDNYLASILEKLSEISDIVRKYGASHVAILGDLFDVPDPSLSVATQVLQRFDEWAVPILVIAGNHDVWGHNSSTMDRTVFGHIVAREKIVKYIGDRDGRLRHLEVGAWAIVGVDFKSTIEDDLRNAAIGSQWLGSGVAGKYVALLTHAQITPRPWPWGPALRPGEVEWPVAMLANGHYHPGADLGHTTLSGAPYIAPGSICRLSKLEVTLDRQVQIAVVDLRSDGIASSVYVPLQSALPADEVFEVVAAESDIRVGERAMTFQEVTLADMAGADPIQVLRSIAAARRLEPRVVEHAIAVVQELST